jgi:hypothetical protein
MAPIETLNQRESTMRWFSKLLATAVVALGCQVATAADFHVAPNGNDADPGTAAKPFATLERARKAVRQINRGMKEDIVVVLRGGTYRLDQTIDFGPEDSGTGGHNVIYRAQAGETPILSGGKPVTGWRPDEKGRWKAPAPVGDFRQLYVNGIRATRARGDAPAGLTLAGEDGYTTTAVEMADWKNPGDLEFCYVCAWAHTRCKLQSIKREGDQAIITMLQPYFTHAKTKEGVNVVSHVDRIYIENALELWNEPGEWYLDRAAKTVYYLPKREEDMNKAEVIAPALEKLVELRGTLDRPVQDIRFEGIAFEYGNWLLPCKVGFVDVQANFVLDEKNIMKRDGGLTAVHSQHLKSPANVVCHAAKSIRFERCTFARLGGAGVDLEYGAQDNVVSGCRFFDIAGSAIQIGDVLKDDHHPDDPRKIVKNNAVVNCYIHDCGLDYWGSIGVFAGYTEGTVIAHNEISRLPYSGISVGYGWGEEDAGGGNPVYYQPFKYDTPTPAKNNRIEYNHIHGVMGKTLDGAGIYTLGNMPGTVIRGNHIHDSTGVVKADRGPVAGVYLDEGSGFIEITGNVVYRVNKPMNYNNLAQNRKATCREHGNWFPTQAEDLSELPSEAKEVAARAGLLPEFRDLLKGNGRP